jgi:hypothetical protein
MSGGPIDQARRGRVAPPVSTNPRTAIHAFGDVPRAYCGRRGVITLAAPDQATCADCLAALAADLQ